MKKLLVFITLSILASGCGESPVQTCVLPNKTYDGCCLNADGPKICNSNNYYLFEDGYLVCKNDSVETQNICRYQNSADGNRY